MSGRPAIAAIVVILLGGAALAGSQAPPVRAAALAPGPAEWEATLVGAETRAGRAEALSVAAMRLQNAWAQHLAAGGKGCRSEEHRSLGARLAPFGEAWRDAVQDARVQVDRVKRMRSTVTVAPLLDEGAAMRADAVSGRVADQARAYLEFRAWHGRHAGNLRECGAPTPASGLRPAQPWERDGAVAILALGEGLVCPAGLPAGGVVLVERSACIGDAGCDCSPDPVHPGAVVAAPAE